MHNRASVEGILWLAEGFEKDTAITGTITLPSAFISLTLNWVSWLYGLLNRAKPGYGGIITQSWLNLSIPECGLMKERYPVRHMPKHTEMDRVKIIRYNNSRRRDAFHIPEDAF